MTDISSLISDLHDQTAVMSSMSMMKKVPAFKQILDIGEDAITGLLSDLEDEPSVPVMILLANITKENPISKEDSGNVQKMATSWFDWGCTNGYL